MLGGLLSAYDLSGGRIVVCGVQKEVATYKDQILMFYLDDGKDFGDRLMVAFEELEVLGVENHRLYFDITQILSVVWGCFQQNMGLCCNLDS